MHGMCDAPEQDQVDFDCERPTVRDVAIDQIDVARGWRAVGLEDPAKVVELPMGVSHHHNAPLRDVWSGGSERVSESMSKGVWQ